METETKTETPRHLRPENCYVCGHEPHAPIRDGHSFWSNADAHAEFAAEDVRIGRPGYVESRYVDQTRGR